MPTRDHKLEQNNFITKLKAELTSFTNENILVVGDFNFYMDPKLYKMDSKSNRNDSHIYRKEIRALLESIDLTACFRNIYPNLRKCTWHAKGKSSRLDYWFISENLLNELKLTQFYQDSIQIIAS